MQCMTAANFPIWPRNILPNIGHDIAANCLDDRSICDEHAECVPNEYGHYICNCHYGYHGNGRTCKRM